MLITKADAWFSKFIRIRDADENGIGTCCTCGKMNDIRYMDCGHYIIRQNKSVRFSEMNTNIQCKQCNGFKEGDKVAFRNFLVKKYSEAKILMLDFEGKKTRKISKFELDQIAKYYKERATELAKEKNIKLW